jgi:hypothetical protein
MTVPVSVTGTVGKAWALAVSDAAVVVGSAESPADGAALLANTASLAACKGPVGALFCAVPKEVKDHKLPAKASENKIRFMGTILLESGSTTVLQRF